MKAKMEEIIAYGRCSDPKQKTSIPIQMEQWNKLVSSDWVSSLLDANVTLGETYIDEGKSGSKNREKRIRFMALLEDIKTIHHGKVIAVVNLSRWSREDNWAAVELYRACKDNGCSILSIDDKKLYSRWDDMDLLEIIFRNKAHHDFSVNISANVSKGMLRSFQNKNNRCSHIPYGMAKLIRYKDGTEKIVSRTNNIRKSKDDEAFLVPGDEIEIEVLRWIYKQIDTKDVSVTSLVKALNKHGNPVVKRGPTGRGWSVKQVLDMLKNPHYAGEEFWGREQTGSFHRVSPDGSVITAKEWKENAFLRCRTEFPPIIEPEQFARVQAKLDSRKANRTKPRASKDGLGYCLTGLLYCGHCGGRMYGRHHGEHVAYNCRTSRIKPGCKCNAWSIREDSLLPFLLEKIEKGIIRKIASVPDVPKQEDNRQGLEQERSRLERRLGQLKSKASSIDGDIDALLDMIVSTEREIKRLDALLAIEPTAQHDVMRNAVDRWEELVKPTLVPIRTSEFALPDNVPGFIVDLAREHDWVNYTLVAPDAIRGQLEGMGTKVTLWFRDERHGNQRYTLDNGKLEMNIGGKPAMFNMTTPVLRGRGKGEGVNSPRRDLKSLQSLTLLARLGKGLRWRRARL